MGNDINRYGGGAILPFWPFEGRRDFLDGLGQAAPVWRTLSTRMPGIHMDRKDGMTVYEFETPGLSKDDVDVRIDGSDLVVSSKSQDDRYSIHYRVTAPDIDRPEDIKARMHDGILEVTVPDGKDPDKNTRIDVE